MHKTGTKCVQEMHHIGMKGFFPLKIEGYMKLSDRKIHTFSSLAKRETQQPATENSSGLLTTILNFLYPTSNVYNKRAQFLFLILYIFSH